MYDLISRKAAIDAMCELMDHWFGADSNDEKREIKTELGKLPSAQPTLYGYKIELLAYIARVMEKEGITAEQAVNSFDDLGMAVRLIIEELQQKVEGAVMK